MKRRDALRGIAGLGVGLGARPIPLFAQPAPGSAGGGPVTTPRVTSDGRIIDATLTGLSAWLPGSDGTGEIRHGVSVRIAGKRIVQIDTSAGRGGGDTIDLTGHFFCLASSAGTRTSRAVRPRVV